MSIHHFRAAMALVREAKETDQAVEDSVVVSNGHARGIMYRRNRAFKKRQSAREMLRER